MLGLRFCGRVFSSCGELELLFIAVRGPLTIAASLVAEHRLQMRRLSSCGSRAQLLRGMWYLPSQGSNPCPLHWQADSQPLCHQGSPKGCNLEWIKESKERNTNIGIKTYKQTVSVQFRRKAHIQKVEHLDRLESLDTPGWDKTPVNSQSLNEGRDTWAATGINSGSSTNPPQSCKQGSSPYPRLPLSQVRKL